MTEQQPTESVLRFRRFALAVCVIGVLVQLGLTAYYLGMGHKAQPRNVPVGLVAAPSDRAEVVGLLTQQGVFKVTDYATVDDLEVAIKRRDVYGGVDITGAQPHLYVASAAGPAAATLLRTTFTTVVQQQAAATLDQLAKSGDRIPVARARALNAPPPITDVVPLPDDDVNGASLGFLTQALALGGTVASMGLGRLIPRTRRSWRRGIAHVSTLAVYAVASAAVVLWSMGWFGVGITADRGEMLAIFSLISLAITASTAGAVAIFGAPGAVIGALYFTLGTVISGASILPEFLPDFGRILGVNLPTGAGVQAVRDNLYFPAAEISQHLTVLALYGGIGALIVLVTNMLPNRRNQTSEVELDLAHRLEGAERREPVNLT
ncbi:ABC transporter permease [Actinoplanes sp. TRM 88003]|uniref:ABC transporter permease n=1 Tax=Paractinoplanes aksuensis TaxID=2939490 RepID=A0ABT1DVE4_9ACTN|nr:ABC transporter permease [Actinoplanes aksuensis]MCO8274839.1 ABC transporter permease [Actinoplanes aksuensis]